MLYFVFFVTIVVVSVVVAILNKNNAAYNSLQTAHLCGLCWSCLTDLNRRPLPYQRFIKIFSQFANMRETTYLCSLPKRNNKK